MRIEINGEGRDVEEGVLISELLQTLGLGDSLVAVERNREIVRRAEHATVRLAEGDQLEIVHFVGGG